MNRIFLVLAFSVFSSPALAQSDCKAVQDQHIKCVEPDPLAELLSMMDEDELENQKLLDELLNLDMNIGKDDPIADLLK